MTQEYSQLQRALETAEAELAKVNVVRIHHSTTKTYIYAYTQIGLFVNDSLQEKSGLSGESNALQKQGDQVVNDTVKLEAQIRENLQVQLTLEKTSASTEAGVGKLNQTYEEKVDIITILVLCSYALVLSFKLLKLTSFFA